MIDANRPLFGLAFLPLVLLLSGSAQLSAQTYSIDTIAGNGTAGFSGDGGPATSAELSGPYTVAVDSAGNIFIADLDNNRIRKVMGGVITTVAGNGTMGSGGDNGSATSAELNSPFSVAVDSTGVLYIADYGNNTIRRVSNGVITTVAGNGTAGFSGDGGPAIDAALNGPTGLFLDSAGNLYVVDSNNSRVRKIAIGIFTTGIITTVAGNGTSGFGGDNGPATSAALMFPQNVAVDSAGNLYIADAGNNRIRKVANGVITTVAGNGTQGFSGDNGPATSAAFNGPSGVAVDSAGTLYIADSDSGHIRKVSNGVVVTIAGNGGSGFGGDNGPALNATFSDPNGITVDSAGNLYVPDAGNNRVRLLSSGAGRVTPLSITTSSLQNGVVLQPYGPVTMAATGGSGNYSWVISDSAGLNISTAGVVSGTPPVAGSFALTITVSSGTATATATFQVTIGAQALPLQIPGGSGASQVTLPGGTVSTPYSQILPATNGNPPYSWSLLGGALPSGLSLSGSGTLSGTPAQAGAFEFTGKVTDSSGASASSIFAITIAPQALTLHGPSVLPDGIAGSDYQPQFFTATGGTPPYTFTLAGGGTTPLSAGLIFSGGEISGVPAAPGLITRALTVTDSGSPAMTDGTEITLGIAASPTPLILSQESVGFSLNTGASGVPPGTNVSVRSASATDPLPYSVVVDPAVPWLDVTRGGTTPGVIGINLDSKALSLGTGLSNTMVVVCLPPSPCTNIAVSLAVTAAPPQLSVDSSLLSFSVQTASSQPVSQTLGLQNVGGGTITVNSITAANSFVTISGAPSTIAPGPASFVTVTIPAGMAAGFYQTTILVNTSAGSASVPVTLLVAQNPTMILNPAGTQFEEAGGSTPGNSKGSFLISVSGSSTVSWNAALLPGAGWLTLNTTSGTSTSANPGSVNFSINATAGSLAPQAYYGAIQVTSSGVVDSPQTFIVILNVVPASTPAQPDLVPAGLLFLSSAGGAPAPQTVQVFTSSANPVTFQASSDSPWLVVSPAVGPTSTASAGSTNVSANLSGLAPGVHRGSVNYALSGAAVRTVNVTLLIEVGAGSSDRTSKAITCAPTQLVPTQTGLVNNFAQPVAFPTPLNVLLVNDCGQPVSNGQVVATFSNGDPPLALVATDTASGNYAGTWTPRNTSGQTTVSARATAAGFPAATVQILGQVTPNIAPLLNPNGTLDAFAISAEPGVPIAPGTIVQIYGSNLTAHTTVGSTIPLATVLDQTSVIIGGLPAPLYYVSPGQINAQVPFELTAGNPYQVIVSANGALSTPSQIQLTSDAPGIAQYAAGQAIAQHVSDNSLITETSPAKPGEYVVFYVAGMGLTNPNVASGVASPSTNLANLLDTAALTLNGAPVPAANILFAGLTPTLVGLYQIDFQVPANAPNGDLSLVLTQTSGLSNSTILPVHN